MKKILIFPALLILIGLFSCKTDTVITDNHDSTDIERHYMDEGFIDSGNFRVIIVQSYNTAISSNEIEKQAKTKARSLLKKYLLSKSKNIDPNADAEILNILNEYGKMTPIDDKEHQRTLFTFTISKQSLQTTIDSLVH